MILSNSLIFDVLFNTSLSKITRLELPAVLSLKLFKIIRSMQEQAKDVYAVRDKLKQLYCKQGSQEFIFNSEVDQDKFLKEMDALSIQTWELPGIEKIKLPKDINITTEDVMNLEPIIDVEKSLEA